VGRPARDVVVIGGSAGAVEAVRDLVAALPADLPAAVGVTLHRHPSAASSLAQVFNRRASMKVIEPEQGETFAPGRVYLAPQDRHMTVFDGAVHLDRQPRQHHTRPAIDPLFRAVARAYGSRVIGVLLTGNLSDGVGGLIAIKEAGGLSLVQDPNQAPHPSMPQNALIYDHVDLIFQIEHLADLLVKLIDGRSVAEVTTSGGARPVRAADVQAPGFMNRKLRTR
jgi:two-component system, chemotaxis family, protein-glutamate methylesterase/glutaminase